MDTLRPGICIHTQFRFNTWIAVPTLYINNDELMLRALKREMTEGVRSKSVYVRHKARVGIVFDVVSLDEVLHAVQRTPLHPLQLYNVRLEKIHLNQNGNLSWSAELQNIEKFITRVYQSRISCVKIKICNFNLVYEYCV